MPWLGYGGFNKSVRVLDTPPQHQHLNVCSQGYLTNVEAKLLYFSVICFVSVNKTNLLDQFCKLAGLNKKHTDLKND